MKSKRITKLALAAAVVCAAVGARASTVYAKISDVSTEPGTGRKYMAYLFVNSDKSGNYASKVTTLTDVLTSLKNRDSLSSSALFYASSYAEKDAATVSWDSSKSGISSSKELSLFALIIDSADVSSASNYMIAKASSNSEYISKNTTSDVTYNWGSQKSNSWTPITSINVPEPTSGVLLLVGVAALALKRKKAA